MQGAPAAFSLDSLTRRLMDLGFSIQQAEKAAEQNPSDVSEAISWLAAAEGGRPSDSNQMPLPVPPRGSSPPICPLPMRSSSFLSSRSGPGQAGLAESSSGSSQAPAGLSALVEMGFAEEVARLALTRHSSVEAAICWIQESIAAGVEESKGAGPGEGRSAEAGGGRGAPGGAASSADDIEIEDPILLQRLPMSQMYMVECRCGHWFGYETLYCGVKTALSEDLIPACPLANHPDESQRCNYLLTQREVEHVLNGHRAPSELPAADRRFWRFRRGKLVDGTYGWVSEKVSDAYLRKGKIEAGCIECPNGRCGYWVEPMRPGEKQKVDCPKCLMSFCSLCKRSYHFRCACDEVMTITRQWLEWQQHGREPYLRKMAEEDQSYQASLEVSKGPG
jgi:hypothetical protein